MKIWDRILSPKTFIGTVLAGLAVYAAIRLLDPLWGKKNETTKVHGSVFEKKEQLTPVYNASVNFLNIQEERTDSSGQFTAQLKGRGTDSITIEVTIPDGQKFNQKLLIDYHKKEVFLDPILFPVNDDTRVKEVSKEEFSQTQKKRPQSAGTDDKKIENTPDTSFDRNQTTEPKEPIDNSEKAEIAVIATKNGKNDIHLTSIFINWLKNNGTASQSILQGLFIEQDYLKQIFDGKYSVIQKTEAAQSVKVVCLLRSTISFIPSTFDKSLVVATCVYEMVVLDAVSGKVIDSLEETIKSSGISEEMAKQRVEGDFFNSLSKRKFSL